MDSKFIDELVGERITLKRTVPTIPMAKAVFKVVDENREHLKPWFPWEKFTVSPDDSIKYLLENETKFKEGEKIEYGIYFRDEYMGNISMFHIDTSKKSAEIGYWLSAKHIRNGYMAEAVRVLEKEFFENQGLNRIQIRCDQRNEASSGVAKKCGYIFEGISREDDYSEYFGDFRNGLTFSKLKSEYSK